MVGEIILLISCRELLAKVFSSDPVVIDMCKDIMVVVTIVIAQDLLQWTLSGTIKALAK